jgi:hypothetical protein
MMIGQKYVVSTNQNYHSERNEKHEDMKEESNRPLPPVPFCFVGTKRLPSSNDDENKNKSSSSTFGSGGGFVLPSITLKKISPKPIFQVNHHQLRRRIVYTQPFFRI